MERTGGTVSGVSALDRTVLIGLDGATFTVLEPLLDDGTMPFLREFVTQGVRSELLSTPNPLTPPAWTSVMTGRSPGNHGIFDFIWAEEREQDTYFTLNTFRDIRCETIWSLVNRQNGRACSLNFPLMAPPPTISGSVVPGLVSWRHVRRNVHPPELFSRLKQLHGFNVKELAWDFELEKKALQIVPPEEYEAWIRFHIRRERQWFQILQHMMQKDPSELTAIIFDGVDKLQHICWRFLDPERISNVPSAWERKIKALCLDYFRQLDGFLAQTVALAGPDARVFIVSDHGFGPTWETFRVNVWLHEHGYLVWRGLSPLDEPTKASVSRLVNGHFVLLDWAKTTAYARTAAANGIYIRVAKAQGQTGVPAEQYEAFRNRLMEQLYDFRDPETGERIVKRILKKEEAFPGGWNAQAPDLTLVLRDHGFVSVLNKKPTLFKRPEIAGTHHPEGIFLARGPGIQRGITIPQLSILDVAPALLYSLGMAIPTDFEGRLPSEVFETSLLRSRPPKVGDPTHPPASDAGPGHGPTEAVAEPNEDALILDRLKALGYIE